MADPEDKTADDAKARKAAADKAAKEAAEPQAPEPSQEDADAIKEGRHRDVKASAPKSSYKTR